MYARIALVLALSWASVAQADEPCAVEPVTVVRWWSQWTSEEARLVLVTCEYEPNLAALDELSILARPHGTDRPESVSRSGEMVAPGIARLDPGLLVRLQALADAFPGRRIEIVSGYRPRARRTSRHRHARALDVRVEGVSRAHVSELARTWPDTGVGYYPNSHFTHIDVRETSAYWVDNSAPGERARYGAPREPAGDVERERREMVAKVVEEIGQIAEPSEAPALTPEETRRLRAEMLEAIDRLIDEPPEPSSGRVRDVDVDRE